MTGDQHLRVLAARFADREAAARVLEQLRAAFDLGPHDAETAPLGAAGDDDGLTLLAGRFHDSRLPDVRRSIERGGGTIVADVDEGWTHPERRPASPAAAARREERRPRVMSHLEHVTVRRTN
jgi:hypothetical protein